MKRHSLVLLLGSLCAVSAALATTYVRVEKDGQTMFTKSGDFAGKGN